MKIQGELLLFLTYLMLIIQQAQLIPTPETAESVSNAIISEIADDGIQKLNQTEKIRELSTEINEIFRTLEIIRERTLSTDMDLNETKIALKELYGRMDTDYDTFVELFSFTDISQVSPDNIKKICSFTKSRYKMIPQTLREIYHKLMPNVSTQNTLWHNLWKDVLNVSSFHPCGDRSSPYDYYLEYYNPTIKAEQQGGLMFIILQEVIVHQKNESVFACGIDIESSSEDLEFMRSDIVHRRSSYEEQFISAVTILDSTYQADYCNPKQVPAPDAEMLNTIVWEIMESVTSKLASPRKSIRHS